MATRVKVNPKGLVEMMGEPEMQAALEATAERLRDRVSKQSPVSTGYYQDHLRARRYPLRRRVLSTDPFAHLVEWGSAHNMAYAPFRRAARSIGLRFKEAPKGQNQ